MQKYSLLRVANFIFQQNATKFVALLFLEKNATKTVAKMTI